MTKKEANKIGWQKALNKFLDRWRDRPDVIGAFVSGSRVHGTHTCNSDIDVPIVLSNGATWRERGNCLIDGYLIEYFCNSEAQLRKYHHDEVKDFSHPTASMLAGAEIVFDKRGVLKRIQNQAKKDLRSKFRRLNKAEVELGKYSIWDDLDNLKDLSEKESSFYCFSHSLLLKKVLDLYRKFLGIDAGPSAKLERYFTDDNFRSRYGLKEFSDQDFVKLFLKAITANNIKSAERVVQHVLEQMGGFEIDGWRFRSKISL